MSKSIPWRMVRTLMISFLLSLLLLAGLTFLLYKFRLSESQISVGIYAVYVISCLTGGFLAGKAMKTRRFLWGLVTGALYFLFLLAMSALQEHGIAAEPTQLLTTLSICTAGGMIGGMLS